MAFKCHQAGCAKISEAIQNYTTTKFRDNYVDLFFAAAMSIPYRFKAGGSGGTATMAPIQPQVHHHRSTTKVDHKPYKPRFASKGDLKDQAKGTSPTSGMRLAC